MLSRPDDERRSAKFDFVPTSAMKHLKLALASDKYKENLATRNVDPTAPEHPCYASLGTVADFHDDLIFFAYEQQLSVDPHNVSYYLECLQTIGEGRDSEDLLTKAAIEESSGRSSLRDIRTAYAHLGLDLRDDTLLDDTIIGRFQARLSDAPKQEAELRRDLGIIGCHRSSLKIQNTAAQIVNNYEQALSFLDANDDTPDEFITTYFTVKRDSKPSDEAIARQAVALIANHRRSKALKHWLDTGVLGEVDMDIGQAYARLDISDRRMDDEMIITVFNLHAEEQPSQAEELKRAFTTIAKERNSKLLIDYAGLEIDNANYHLNEWPVALNNIGNTCYLNSLLQFYFSIKPFRDLVLNIDEFKTPVDDEHVEKKRVGGRSVSRKEIERAQRLAEELKKLFKHLISSNTRSVRPDTEVARLTLLTPKAEIARRQSIRQSMNQGQRPFLPGSDNVVDTSTATNSAGIQEHQAASEDAVMVDSLSETMSPITTMNDHNSNNSSETLVEGPAAVENAMASDASEIEQRQQLALDSRGDAMNIENEAVSTETAAANLSLLNQSLSHQGGVESAFKGTGSTPNNFDIDQKSPAKAKSIPPSQPPPIPPRPKTTVDPDEAVKEAEFAAQQQDVNEISYNVLNQLQCAIVPQELDDTGEQIDQVKHLFYGKQKTYITNASGDVRSKEEYMSDIKVNVQGGSLDIYEALDGAFDVEDVAVAGSIQPKYYTISQLPPILQIHIQRGQYDPQTKKQFKSNNHIALKEVIYMDRYMDTSDAELLQRRTESWKWKRQLSNLLTRQDQLMASDVSSTTIKPRYADKDRWAWKCQRFSPVPLGTCTSLQASKASIELTFRWDSPKLLTKLLQKQKRN